MKTGKVILTLVCAALVAGLFSLALAGCTPDAKEPPAAKPSSSEHLDSEHPGSEHPR